MLISVSLLSLLPEQCTDRPTYWKHTPVFSLFPRREISELWTFFQSHRGLQATVNLLPLSSRSEYQNAKLFSSSSTFLPHFQGEDPGLCVFSLSNRAMSAVESCLLFFSRTTCKNARMYWNGTGSKLYFSPFL